MGIASSNYYSSPALAANLQKDDEILRIVPVIIILLLSIWPLLGGGIGENLFFAVFLIHLLSLRQRD